MLTPRFAIDGRGNFAISRSPFVISREEGDERAFIRFFCAVLNSSVCNWHLRTRATKYSKGYNRLEVSVLNEVPVPDLGKVDAKTLAEIIDAVDQLSKKPDPSVDNTLDHIICELY